MINEHQPMPEKNEEPAIWDLVIADMQDRDKTGQKRYGTRLQPFNGRDALVDAYQEALDLVVYLRQIIYERDNHFGKQVGYPVPTLKPYWKAPVVMCELCSIPMELYALWTGDGWYVGMACPDCQEEAEESEDFWPFEEDFAAPEDFRRLGIEIV